MSIGRLLWSLIPWLCFSCTKYGPLPPLAPDFQFSDPVAKGLEPGKDPSSKTPATGAAPESALAKQGEVRPPLGSPIPGGDDCLQRLQEDKVAFSKHEPVRGVKTPVLVKGPLGGIEYFSDAMPFIADCRLVLALESLGPEFKALGITRMRFSGAYVYRYTRKGRLSYHANGLAIDIHEMWFGAERLSVKKDFSKGLGRECKTAMPLLNQLACGVYREHVFKELLTPDDNADHYDHFHLGLAPLPEEVETAPEPIKLTPPDRSNQAHDRVRDLPQHAKR